MHKFTKTNKENIRDIFTEETGVKVRKKKNFAVPAGAFAVCAAVLAVMIITGPLAPAQKSASPDISSDPAKEGIVAVVDNDAPPADLQNESEEMIDKNEELVPNSESLAVGSCVPSPEDINHMIHVSFSLCGMGDDSEKLYELSGDDAVFFLDMLNGREGWMETMPNCMFDVSFAVSADEEDNISYYDYHTECGNLFYGDECLCICLSEELKAELNAMISAYSGKEL